MRVVAGELKGQKLVAPQGWKVRPTSERVREAVFSTLGERVEGAVVLPDVEIGEHVRLKNVIIDRGVRIPDRLVVGEGPELDALRFRRTAGGVCLITQEMLDRLQ